MHVRPASAGLVGSKVLLFSHNDRQEGGYCGKAGIIPDPLCANRATAWRAAQFYICGSTTSTLVFMALTPQDIERIAHLARLALSPAEAERMHTQLNGFFAIVEQMRAVDTSGLTPLPHPVATVQPVALRLRDDVASEPNQRERNQRSAPAVERGLYLVPKVIE